MIHHLSRHHAYLALRLVLGLFLLCGVIGGTLDHKASATSEQPDLPEPVPCAGCSYPPATGQAQYQLSPADGHDATGGIAVDVKARPFRSDIGKTAEVFDIDLYVDAEVAGDAHTPNAAAVAAIHERGGYAICYVSAGSWERWRPDAGDFPAAVKGKKNGWPGERWLDITDTETLMPIMTARVQKCEEAGFDAVEWDNVDGYRNDTGFDLRGRDQLEFNTTGQPRPRARAGRRTEERSRSDRETPRLLRFRGERAVFSIRRVQPAPAVPRCGQGRVPGGVREEAARLLPRGQPSRPQRDVQVVSAWSEAVDAMLVTPGRAA